MLLGLEYLDLAILLFSSFLGSLMTAALGVGGGAFLITVMAEILPPLALIPVHGLVQLGSNGSRAVLTRKHTQWQKVVWFLGGAIVASVVSVMFLQHFDTDWIPLVIAFFILWLCWGPIPEIGLGTTRSGLFSGGAVTTLASMLVGASGPLVSAWLGAKNAERWTYTANFATCMTLQHGLKLERVDLCCTCSNQPTLVTT
ncbi:MAG: TSUP family transporter [Aestuariibacter sp.]